MQDTAMQYARQQYENDRIARFRFGYTIVIFTVCWIIALIVAANTSRDPQWIGWTWWAIWSGAASVLIPLLLYGFTLMLANSNDDD